MGALRVWQIRLSTPPRVEGESELFPKGVKSELCRLNQREYGWWSRAWFLELVYTLCGLR